MLEFIPMLKKTCLCSLAEKHVGLLPLKLMVSPEEKKMKKKNGA